MIRLPVLNAGGDEPSSIGSMLCLSCGMCCRGVIYPSALLDPDELEKATQLQVRVFQKVDGHDAFVLPCPHHAYESNACSIYDDRFHACRRYTCDLLKLLLEGGIELDQALDIVTRTRALETRIYEAVGGRDSTRDIWTQVDEFLRASGIDDATERNTRYAGLLLDARMLSLLGHRHFEARMHKKLNANAGPSPARPTAMQ